MPGDWDLDLVFDDTYLHFYREVLSAERTAEDCDRILRLLDSSSRGRLADLCCGHGRHARELARRGIEVVGADRSHRFLRRAVDGAPTRARFVLADVAALPLADGCVDGAYCWFSSIGYHGPAEDLALLREAWRILRPGARVAVESRNWATVTSGERVLETPVGRIVDRVERDDGSRRLRTHRRYEPAAGEPREVAFSLHLYDAAEFIGLLHAAGFADVRAFDEGDRPFTAEAHRVAFAARRSAGAP